MCCCCRSTKQFSRLTVTVEQVIVSHEQTLSVEAPTAYYCYYENNNDNSNNHRHHHHHEHRRRVSLTLWSPLLMIFCHKPRERERTEFVRSIVKANTLASFRVVWQIFPFSSVANQHTILVRGRGVYQIGLKLTCYKLTKEICKLDKVCCLRSADFA